MALVLLHETLALKISWPVLSIIKRCLSNFLSGNFVTLLPELAPQFPYSQLLKKIPGSSAWP